MDIYVDGGVVMTWTSSGTSTGFDIAHVGVRGQIIELRAILADSEWISILEVRRCQMVRDGWGHRLDIVLPTEYAIPRQTQIFFVVEG